MSTFIECQHGLLNADYVVRVSLPFRSLPSGDWMFTVYSLSEQFTQEFETEEKCRKAFNYINQVLVTNVGG